MNHEPKPRCGDDFSFPGRDDTRAPGVRCDRDVANVCTVHRIFTCAYHACEACRMLGEEDERQIPAFPRWEDEEGDVDDGERKRAELEKCWAVWAWWGAAGGVAP